jgi:hypothetical protein
MENNGKHTEWNNEETQTKDMKTHENSVLQR